MAITIRQIDPGVITKTTPQKTPVVKATPIKTTPVKTTPIKVTPAKPTPVSVPISSGKPTQPVNSKPTVTPVVSTPKKTPLQPKPAETPIVAAVKSVSSSPKKAENTLFAKAKLQDDNDSEQPKPTPLQLAIGLAQGAILDLFFDVDLTGGAGTEFGDWRAWTEQPERINQAFRATVLNAAMYNQVAQQNGFVPSSPVWLFRNINGPLELRQVDKLPGGIYAQTALNLQQPIHVTFPDGQFVDAPTWTWGAARQAVHQGGTMENNSSTLIQLTDHAFESGAVTGTRFHFPAGFIIDHELGHIIQANWRVNENYLANEYRELSQEAFANAGIRVIVQGTPDTGARSEDADYEYLADAIANYANLDGGFDLNDPDQVIRQQVVSDLIWELIQEKFT